MRTGTAGYFTSNSVARPTVATTSSRCGMTMSHWGLHASAAASSETPGVGGVEHLCHAGGVSLDEEDTSPLLLVLSSPHRFLGVCGNAGLPREGSGRRRIRRRGPLSVDVDPHAGRDPAQPPRQADQDLAQVDAR